MAKFVCATIKSRYGFLSLYMLFFMMMITGIFLCMLGVGEQPVDDGMSDAAVQAIEDAREPLKMTGLGLLIGGAAGAITVDNIVRDKLMLQFEDHDDEFYGDGPIQRERFDEPDHWHRMYLITMCSLAIIFTLLAIYVQQTTSMLWVGMGCVLIGGRAAWMGVYELTRAEDYSMVLDPNGNVICDRSSTHIGYTAQDRQYPQMLAPQKGEEAYGKGMGPHCTPEELRRRREKYNNMPSGHVAGSFFDSHVGRPKYLREDLEKDLFQEYKDYYTRKSVIQDGEVGVAYDIKQSIKDERRERDQRKEAIRLRRRMERELKACEPSPSSSSERGLKAEVSEQRSNI